MKHLLLAALVATLVGANTGCCLLDRLACRTREYPVNLGRGACGPNCNRCGPLGHGGLGGGGIAGHKAAKYAGPATGAVTYPYYTTRGPRDFLAANPRDIGP